jgi:hypothetical protein
LEATLALENRFSPALVALLERGWEKQLSAGIVEYDPAAALSFSLPPYSYHCLPERARRPRSGAGERAPPPSEGVRLRHAPCAFDSPEFEAERGIGRVGRYARGYILACNRYPVTRLHSLAIRLPSEPEATLPQCLQGGAELEDILILLVMLGPPFRSYFNSNRGADGSFSGSSVNHWHIQIFPYFPDSPSTLLSAPAETHTLEDGVRVGEVPSWPAAHLFVEAGPERTRAAAVRLWQEIEVLNRLGAAYNLEAVALGDGRYRAFLFPRRPAPPIAIDGLGVLSSNIGGCELSGHLVVPSRDLFEWLRARPAEANAITTRRLRETTRRPVTVAP